MELQERVDAYWSKRADEFSDARYRDLHSQNRRQWLGVIRSFLPQTEPIRALDLGTGAGFFVFLLDELGCVVTGVDYSQAMVDNALKLREVLGRPGIEFRQMDAQSLTLPDGGFDFIFTRNVTWTLPDPARAYGEMCRVLAPGGRLLNFDANYGAAFHQYDAQGLTEAQAVQDDAYAHPARSLAMLRERNDLAWDLPISRRDRPRWDAEVLARLGMEHIATDGDAGRFFPRPEPEDKSWRDPSPLFLVTAQKPEGGL